MKAEWCFFWVSQKTHYGWEKKNYGFEDWGVRMIQNR
jgi:hypothetical protein